VLTVQEIHDALLKAKVTESEMKDLELLVKSIDTSQTGTINYTEFLAALMEQSIYM